jgi:exodeoxyribonuclease V gamma subunit
MKEDAEQNVNDNLRCVFSNCWESLAEALAQALYAKGSSPFEARYVLVPTDRLKEFLVFYLARHLDIAAGMTCFSLEQGIRELLAQALPDTKKMMPSFLDLSLFIEEKIHLALSEGSSLFSPVSDYLSAQDGGVIPSDKKITALSEQMAHLFIRYGTYGEIFLKQWTLKKGWQQWIWDQVFSTHSPFTYPIEILKIRKVRNCQIHLFGFEYLAPIYLTFFSRSKAVFYQFSPCAMYWEDLCTDRERLGFFRALTRKGAKTSVCSEMENYLNEHHPLLANWGKLGREFLKSLDLFSLDAQESYAEAQTQKRLLHRVKESILHLQEYEGEIDDSIQIHSAPSKLREVEMAKEAIQTLLQRHAADAFPLRPKDIVILAPDMGLYASYVHMVFAGTPIAYSIEGLEQGSRSEFMQALFHFLSLVEGEFSLSAVMRLFFMRPFRVKWNFSFEELCRIQSYLMKAHVRSGEKSWEEAIDRLLMSLAVKSGIAEMDAVHVAQTDMELLDKFLSCFFAVKRDLTSLRSAKKKFLWEWLAEIEGLCLKYFEGAAQEEPLLKQLRALPILHLNSKHWGFFRVHRILQHFYEKRTAHIFSEHLQKLTFCSLESGNTRPARVIYILGLDEESFPRFETAYSLCELSTFKKKPYFPVKGDKDRYLFLELLCQAQDYFIISYERVHSKDNKLQGPSYLVEELREYVKKELIGIDHAPLSFANPTYKKRDFFSAAVPQESDCPYLQISSLRLLAKHPFRFYFNQVLGMYLQREESLEDSAFCLSALHKHILKRALLKSPFPSVIEECEKRGLLPEGIFKQAAIDSLLSERDDCAKAFEDFSLKGEDVFSIEFSLHCESGIRTDEGNWVLPALSFIKEEKEIYLTGALGDITPEGYLVHGRPDLETLILNWPLLLIFLCARGDLGGIPSRILFSKTGKALDISLEDPRLLLEKYIAYCFKAQSSPSPLMPKWATVLLLKEEEDFEKSVHKAFSKEGLTYFDFYLEWMRKAEISFSPKEMFAQWAPYLRKLFKPALSLLREEP